MKLFKNPSSNKIFIKHMQLAPGHFTVPINRKRLKFTTLVGMIDKRIEPYTREEKPFYLPEKIRNNLYFCLWEKDHNPLIEAYDIMLFDPAIDDFAVFGWISYSEIQNYCELADSKVLKIYCIPLNLLRPQKELTRVYNQIVFHGPLASTFK